MGVVLSLATLQFSAGDRVYISAGLAAVYPTAPSGQVCAALVVHNVLLQSAVALVLKYFSVEACDGTISF